MEKGAKIVLANKRRVNVTDKAYVYSIGGYGKGIFSIAKKLVLNKKPSEIEVNEYHIFPAVEYEITQWMFKQIKDDLEKMAEHHCIILKD